MPSFKEHSLFAILFIIPFFPNPYSIALALIGAALVDFDHNIKKENIYKILLLGLLVTVILYILSLPPIIGIIIVLVGLIFYFSNHRGFTHSLLGTLLLTVLLTILITLTFILLSVGFIFTLSLFTLDVLNYSNGMNIISSLSIFIILILLGALSLHKRLKIPFTVLLLLGMVLIPFNSWVELNPVTYPILNSFFNEISSLNILNNMNIINLSLSLPSFSLENLQVYNNLIFNNLVSSELIFSNPVSDNLVYNILPNKLLDNILSPNLKFSFFIMMFSLFGGFISHLAIDSLTPKGIELLRPISSKKVRKVFGLIIITLWIGASILSIYLKMIN